MTETRRIWLMDQRLFRAQRLGKALPFKEHILSGYSELKSKQASNPIEDLSNQCTEKRLILKNGAELILLTPTKKTMHVLVSHHGGPESYEGTEIRYLGLYRALLKKGWTVAILNYRGSTQLRAPKKQTWKNWKDSILQDFSDVLSISELNSKSINLLGASFGGALALIVLKKFKINKCVLLSPLLDLKNQKIRAGADYKNWFGSRFSSKDYKDFSFQELAANLSAKILIICSQNDEVLGNAMNLLLQNKSSKSLSSAQVISQRTSHCPKSFHSSFERFNLAFKFLTA